MHLPSASPISAAFFVSASLIFGGSFWFFDCSWLHFVILSETSWAHLASLHLHISSLNSVIFAIAAPDVEPPFFLQPNESTTSAETTTNVSFFIEGLLEDGNDRGSPSTKQFRMSGVMSAISAMYRLVTSRPRRSSSPKSETGSTLGARFI